MCKKIHNQTKILFQLYSYILQIVTVLVIILKNYTIFILYVPLTFNFVDDLTLRATTL